jgi:hypothetical protein
MGLPHSPLENRKEQLYQNRQNLPKTYRLTQSCERNMPSSSSIPTLNWKPLPPAAALLHIDIQRRVIAPETPRMIYKWRMF